MADWLADWLDGWVDGWIDRWMASGGETHTSLFLSLSKKKRTVVTRRAETNYTYLPDASNPARTRRFILLLSSN